MQARGPRMRTKDAGDDLGDEVLRHLQQLLVGGSALRRITHCAIIARLCIPSEPLRDHPRIGFLDELGAMRG